MDRSPGLGALSREEGGGIMSDEKRIRKGEYELTRKGGAPFDDEEEEGFQQWDDEDDSGMVDRVTGYITNEKTFRITVIGLLTVIVILCVCILLLAIGIVVILALLPDRVEVMAGVLEHSLFIKARCVLGVECTPVITNIFGPVVAQGICDGIGPAVQECGLGTTSNIDSSLLSELGLESYATVTDTGVSRSSL